jgi:uncharacterized glyoxalase superfamily protein PhnB
VTTDTIKLTATLPVLPVTECRSAIAFFAELEPKGVIDPEEPIRTTPWGTRQFSVLDCCGNRITFTGAK